MEPVIHIRGVQKSFPGPQGLAFCTSRNFVRGRWIPNHPLNSHIVE